MKISPLIEKYVTWPNIKSQILKVRPRHIMFGMMFCVGMVRSCYSPNKLNENGADAMKWAYEQGQQNMRDSLKIAELRDSLKMAEKYNKTIADSMKYYHSLAKCK